MIMGFGDFLIDFIPLMSLFFGETFYGGTDELAIMAFNSAANDLESVFFSSNIVLKELIEPLCMLGIGISSSFKLVRSIFASLLLGFTVGGSSPPGPGVMTEICAGVARIGAGGGLACVLLMKYCITWSSSPCALVGDEYLR